MKKYTVRYLLLLLCFVLVLSACGQQEQQADAAQNSYEDVTALVREAQQLYQAGSYRECLEKYLTAMEKNPRDMEARMGVIHAQIALERYDLALINLDMAQQLDPENLEICQAYLTMAQKASNTGYAHTAVKLAEQYGHESILQLVPEEPVFQLEEGSFDQQMTLEITADPDVELYVSLDNDVLNTNSMYNDPYTQPILLMRGTNTVSAYTMKDGIPSAEVTKIYTVDYPCVNVEFRESLMEELALVVLGKTEGPVTNYECETVTDLSWYDLQKTYTSYYEYEALRINSLEDLKYFPSLRYLFLNNQDKIKDFSPLKNCPYLFQVGVEECGLKNTDFVRYCPSVEHFNLGNNEITDISALIEKKEVYGVALRGNAGKVDLTALIKAHPEMYRLEVNDELLPDYSILQELDELTTLYINGIQHLDREGLSKLTDLRMLDISMDYSAREYNLELTDLSFLENMPELENLYLNGVSKAADLEYIKGLEKLQYLYLYNCPVADNVKLMDQLAAALPEGCKFYY